MTMNRKRNLVSIIEKEVPESSVPMSKLCWKEEEKALCQCILKDTTVYICSSKIVFSSPLSQWKQERPFDYYAVQCKIYTQTTIKQNFTSAHRSLWDSITLKITQMSYLIFSILAFSANFRPIKLTCLVTLFDLQASSFQKLVKVDHFWHFELM